MKTTRVNLVPGILILASSPVSRFQRTDTKVTCTLTSGLYLPCMLRDIAKDFPVGVNIEGLTIRYFVKY